MNIQLDSKIDFHFVFEFAKS